MVKWDESSRGVSTLWRGECDLQGVSRDRQLLFFVILKWLFKTDADTWLFAWTAKLSPAYFSIAGECLRFIMAGRLRGDRQLETPKSDEPSRPRSPLFPKTDNLSRSASSIQCYTKVWAVEHVFLFGSFSMSKIPIRKFIFCKFLANKGLKMSI